MRVLLQRVTSASVEVEGRTTGKIGDGFLLLAGITDADDLDTVAFVAEKIANLRVFEDADGKMNLSALDRLAGGSTTGMLVVSQFTLYGDVRKGRRPSFTRAAGPLLAERLVDHFADQFRALGLAVETGEFGAHMKVSLVNDGPVTIWIDSDDLRQSRRGRHE